MAPLDRHAALRPATDAQRATIMALWLDHPEAHVHPRPPANLPIWVTWPGGGARVMPDGTAAGLSRPAGPEPVDCYACAYLRRELTVRCEPWERALIEAQRAARAEACPVCQGLGFLGDAGATALSTVPPRHDSELAVRADWWTDQHPGQAAQEVRPYRYDATTEQVRAAFAARRREHPGELASEAQRALADHLGLTPRTVKRRLARGRYAAHGDRPLREVLDAELTDG